MVTENTKAMVVAQQVAPMPWTPANFDQGMAMAMQLAKSNLLPEALRGKPADVLLVLMTGHEFGLSPMQALRSINVVKGKTVMDASMIVGQCLRHRDVCEFFTLVESTDKIATYEAKRAGAPSPSRMSFTIEQAKAAGLTSKDNWRNFPAAMLRARCSSHLARAVFPDLAAGVYDLDEGEEIAGHARRAPVRIVESKPTAPAATFDTAAQPPAASKVVEGEVVSEAHTASGSMLRIVDEPAPASEPGPSAYDELLAELEQHGDEAGFKAWIARKDSAVARGTLSQEQIGSLRDAYKARWNAVKGGQ